LLTGWKCVQNEFDFERPDFCLKTDALKFEEGSMNLLGIFGLGAALELLFEVGIGNIEDRVQGLGDVIIKEAEERGFRVLTPRERLDRGGSVTVSGKFDPNTMRDALRGEGIMVNVRGGGIRVSPHFYNTEAELMALFERIGRVQGR
jgi:selenocysteine lyase/cysteine desulfurase